MRLTSPFGAAEVISNSPFSHLGALIVLWIIYNEGGLNYAKPKDDDLYKVCAGDAENKGYIENSFWVLVWTNFICMILSCGGILNDRSFGTKVWYE